MGFTANFRLSSYFFPVTVDGDAYLEMLWTHVRPGLVAKRKLSATTFMQDGAPPHIKAEVKQFLLRTFTEDHLISQGFRQFWPPYSPDLNCLDYFFWGYVRDLVYAEGIFSNVNELKNKIIEAYATVTQDQMQKAVYHLLDRCRLVVEEGGGHIEHLM